MCLVLLAIDALPDTPLLVLGNRDEFHARPSAPAAPWREDARILGGRDLQAGGSWLAARSDGRWALVTNHRVWPPPQAPRSRGLLVGDFMRGTETSDVAAQRVLRTAHDYAPFHLLLGQGTNIKMRFLERTAGSFWLAISAQSLSPRRRRLARIPAKTGVDSSSPRKRGSSDFSKRWIPACAGMTKD
ncbi:MAG: NRDE family protein [Metallibacterium sp.]